LLSLGLAIGEFGGLVGGFIHGVNNGYQRVVTLGKNAAALNNVVAV
jgi:hypothetical protein